MTDLPILLVVHGAPLLRYRDTAESRRLRRYLHLGNVQRLYPEGAAFHNWARRCFLETHADVAPVGVVVTTDAWGPVLDRIDARELKVAQGLGLRDFVPAFKRVCLHWDYLIETLNATPECEPLKLPEGIALTPLRRPTGSLHGYRIAGPWGSVTSNTFDQVEYALEYVEQVERYRATKISGRGPRTTWWEAEDLVDMPRLGYLHNTAVIRLTMARAKPRFFVPASGATVVLSAPKARRASPACEPPIEIPGEHDNTSFKRVVREHAGAHSVIREIQWDVSWNPITRLYEAQRSDGREIAHLHPTDLRNMIAVGKLEPYGGATTPYPDLDTFNRCVMGHPKERRLERNGILRKHVEGLDADNHGTQDIPSNKRKAIMDDLKYHLERYELYADIYARMSKRLEYGAGERKVGMPPELGMPYGSAREALLGKEGAQAQRDSAAKQAADAKAAAFPCVVRAGEITVRGEKKRLFARVSHVTAGVISATMAGTNSWRKGQDNTHLELIRNAQIDRTHFGYEKYGVTLDRDDLSLAQLDQHAFEEALDLVCYLRARIRAMNKISGNGTKYGPDEEWIEPLVHEAHNLLEGLARQVLRTNPEANKLSQYVELEEPFSDAGKNRLFEDLKAGKVQTIVDINYGGVVDFEMASRHAMFSPSAPASWAIPTERVYSGGVYSGKDGGGIFGDRGPEMVISKSQAERFEDKLKNFRASYKIGPIKDLKIRVKPMTESEAAEMVARYREAHPNAYRFWSKNALFTDEQMVTSGLFGDKTEKRGDFWVTKNEAEYLDAQPKPGEPGYRPTSYCLDWYRNERTISHANAMRLSKLTNTKDEPMDPNSTFKHTGTAHGSTHMGKTQPENLNRESPKSGMLTEFCLEQAKHHGKSFNLLIRSMHGLAVNAGWWHDLKTGELKSVESEFGTKIALIHSEISEALEGQRKNLMDDYLPHRKAVEVELADAVIRIGDLAGRMGLDLGGAIAEKLAYNAQRADHKPENRAAEGGKQF